MALAEYRYGDRTYLFDEKDVPQGAELVTAEVRDRRVNVFPDQKVADDTKAEEPAEKAAATPANKAGRKPADKAAKADKSKD